MIPGWYFFKTFVRGVSWRVWAALAVVLALWWLVHRGNAAKADLAKIRGEKDAAIAEQKAELKRVERGMEQVSITAKARLAGAKNDAAAAADAADRALQRVRERAVADAEAGGEFTRGSQATADPAVLPADLLGVCAQHVQRLAEYTDQVIIRGWACENAADEAAGRKPRNPVIQK